MLNKIKPLAERVAEYLGVEIITIEFENIVDDSRLVLRPEVKIVINSKYQDDYFECAKAVTHEYRHLFQMYWVAIMKDERARRWKAAFGNSLSSENADITSNIVDATRYAYQETELDAFAFTKYFLGKFEGMKVVHPSEAYEMVIEKYIRVNKGVLLRKVKVKKELLRLKQSHHFWFIIAKTIENLFKSYLLCYNKVNN